jgi:sarcosine oxidase subunit gamma
MVDAVIAKRTAAAEGLPSFGRKGRFTIEALPFLSRYNFRGSEAAAHDLGLAFGAELSRVPLVGNETAETGRAALWLGPDEWQLIGPELDHATIAETVARVVVEPHSLTDVSHRNTGITLRGSKVTQVLNAGMPLDLDLSVFPVGMCTRTIFLKADIILWRRAHDTFYVECFRSFLPYLWAQLEEAAREYVS